jgi:cytochrome P450
VTVHSERASTVVPSDARSFGPDALRELDDVARSGGAPPRPLPGTQYWLVSRYRDVKAALGDWRSFGTWAGFEWEDGGGSLPAGFPGTPSVRGSRVATGQTPLLFTDPPTHTRWRALLSRAWGRTEHLRRVERALATLGSQHVAWMRKRSSLDLASEFAVPYASAALASFLGVDRRQWQQLGAGGGRSLPLGEPHELLADEALRRLWGAGLDAAVARRSDLLGLIESRHVDPLPGALTSMLQPEGVDRDVMTTAQVVSLLETADLVARKPLSNLVCLAAVEVGRRPRLLRHLRQHPEHVRLAVNEAVRLWSPSSRTVRRARVPTMLGGVEIPPGGEMMVWLDSANRDPRQFDRPHELRLTRRSPYSHLGWGHGIHRCPGAQLSMSVATAAVRLIVEHWPDFAPAASEPIRYDGSPLDRHVLQAQVQLHWDPARLDRPRGGGGSAADQAALRRDDVGDLFEW